MELVSNPGSGDLLTLSPVPTCLMSPVAMALNTNHLNGARTPCRPV
jgi:hypothetical protein